MRKIFVIDTCVLLYDKNAIHSFPGNDVIIPIVVLDELDRFKEKPGIIGENARYVNRYLDNLRKKGDLSEGVYLEEIDQKIKIDLDCCKVPKGLTETADNKILGLAERIQKDQGYMVTVITKDINFRVKCDSLKISAEDYYRDHLQEEGEDFKGYKQISVSSETIQNFYDEGSVKIDNKEHDLIENEFVIATSEIDPKQSFLGCYRKNKIYKLTKQSEGIIKNVTPRSKEQRFALSALLDDAIKLVTLTGLAGSGKTLLSLVAGLEGLYNKKYERIVITRSMQPVGKDIGFLPGTVHDKMQPWITPIVDNFRFAFKDVSYFKGMVEKGDIEIAPITYMRGRTFNNAYIIVDEAQNASIHELKTIITRVGQDSKIVLLGDVDQIDTPYIDRNSNGLSIVREKMKKEKLTAHVTLARGERSELASVASNKL